MKNFKRFLTLVMALSLVMGMTAFAGDTTIETITDVAENTQVEGYEGAVNFDLTYTAGTPNGMYLILVLKDGAMADGSIPEATDILYVNQATADGNGNVVFENVYPSVIEKGSIYMVGTDMSLTSLGTIIANAADFILGDVNEDGYIDYGDLQRLYQHLSTDSKLTGAALDSANVNGDTGVDYGDLQRLYQHLSTDNKLPN